MRHARRARARAHRRCAYPRQSCPAVTAARGAVVAAGGLDAADAFGARDRASRRKPLARASTVGALHVPFHPDETAAAATLAMCWAAAR